MVDELLNFVISSNPIFKSNSDTKIVFAYKYLVFGKILVIEIIVTNL
jgi:hypothetical protein